MVLRHMKVWVCSLAPLGSTCMVHDAVSVRSAGSIACVWEVWATLGMEQGGSPRVGVKGNLPQGLLP